MFLSLTIQRRSNKIRTLSDTHLSAANDRELCGLVRNTVENAGGLTLDSGWSHRILPETTSRTGKTSEEDGVRRNVRSK
ncbi:hypothetical protein Y032_0044g957 [Ancylostoma ceylanicum]|uniref:Uncharacterized protein n=1 Tax=Ancylostoma ceylanicum TaxID=53326 RepID=A0A016UEM4_9BILA|nr:hypothetical protein Y032_0044g957 [Ancylostoma ceylanicum]